MNSSRKVRVSRQKRNQRGQSMVEYALGLGCVSALCMVALGSLGFICGDMIYNVQNAINYGGNTAPQPGRMINPNATPWVIE
ncbi:MAG: hypothetical protein JST89_24745 [Cyanobacteria bacterium SZAS-4]|nr:hypothetical protein [Cyanobacteria bacterium SZAS-4]